MGTVAEDLKAEREKQHIPLAHIAAETRISLRHLESLEEGRYKDMPGGIYNRAFLKACCEILNLNAKEMLGRYEAEISSASDKSHRGKAKTPQIRRSSGISPLLIWGLMLIFSATGLYFSRKWIMAVFSPYFSHSPPTPASNEYPKADDDPQTPQPVVSPVPDNPSPSLPSSAPQEPTNALSAGDGAVTSIPRDMADPAQAFRLEIIATEKCWVSIQRDGELAFRGNLHPGDVQAFEVKDRVVIIAGNAGGVHLKVNGETVKPLGKAGAVVRIVVDGKNLQEILNQNAG